MEKASINPIGYIIYMKRKIETRFNKTPAPLGLSLGAPRLSDNRRWLYFFIVPPLLLV